MTPFGFQIVIYLFLAGISAGAASFSSFALAARKVAAFHGGKRSLVVAILCALTGSVFLILDLTRPADFVLILTSANSESAISWGARILVLFILSAIFVRVTVRNWGEREVETGFKGTDLIGLCLLRLAALGLAIYPAFVLRQGEAFPLWQNSLLIPLLAVSAFHAGVAAAVWITPCVECKRKARSGEIVLGAIQLLLLVALLIGEGGSAFAWGVILVIGTLIPLLLVVLKSESTLPVRVFLILLGAFAFRYWLITAGQTI